MRLEHPVMHCMYCGPKHNKKPRWVPAVVTKMRGSRTVNVRVYPKGPTWHRHIDQLRPRYGVNEDTDPGETPIIRSDKSIFPSTTPTEETSSSSTIPMVPMFPSPPAKRNYRKPTPTEDNYGPTNPRRSAKIRQRQEHDVSANPQLVGR